MPKRRFSDEIMSIWGQIEGQKNLGISSARTENLVDILRREVGLEPFMYRLDDDFYPWDSKGFRNAHITKGLDGSCQVYYTPEACQNATGSRAHNWLKWSSTLLDYGRKTHRYAPKISLRQFPGLLSELRTSGILTAGRFTTRLLSLEAVVFYLACQVRTWPDGNTILRVKDRIEDQDITTIGFTVAQDEINMNALFDNDTQGTPPRTRVPKAGQQLMDYVPVALPEKNVTGTRKDPIESGVLVANIDDILNNKQPAYDTQAASNIDPMSDADIEAQIAVLQAKLEARKLARARKRLEAEASRGQFLGGDVSGSLPQWDVVRIQYPDGQVVSYSRVAG